MKRLDASLVGVLPLLLTFTACTANATAIPTIPPSTIDPAPTITPAATPKNPIVGAVPVWYDAKGLHRGDVVEQPPVKLVEPDQAVGPGRVIPAKGAALALVRSGAVYLSPATRDVWFHPWGGDPRIVGRNSEAGPGGDPNGDTAAWFEGPDQAGGSRVGEVMLVVYDTAAGREVSRTLQSSGATFPGMDHRPPGNSFLQVSSERVVWTDGPETHSHDVRSRTTSVLQVDEVHDQVEVFRDQAPSLVVRVPGRAEERYPDLFFFARLSPSGNYLLAVEETEARHGAVTVDTRTGKLWRVPTDEYPWIAWSYGDIAMVDTEDGLLACDAARRACERLAAERPFLMPTN